MAGWGRVRSIFPRRKVKSCTRLHRNVSNPVSAVRSLIPSRISRSSKTTRTNDERRSVSSPLRQGGPPRADSPSVRAGPLREIFSGRTIVSKTASEYLVEALEKAGVKRVYGVVGDSLNGFTDAMRRRKSIAWIHMRHEEAAAFAAGAEAHLTGSL